MVERLNPHVSKIEELPHPEIQRRSFGCWGRLSHPPPKRVHYGTDFDRVSR